MNKKQENNLKFETDSVYLSDEQIEKHKNFNKLIHEYQNAIKPLYKTPLYKNKNVFLVVLLILLVLFIIVESVLTDEKKEVPSNTQQEK
jgi:hypothetical protein